ncbi:MAG: hypothetical protein LBV34_01905 [Nocardiopsaceae bacterium]|jgi:hypothetical protein|nr:hypothetical protein [Nocardiopsaceae bacterium]
MSLTRRIGRPLAVFAASALAVMIACGGTALAEEPSGGTAPTAGEHLTATLGDATPTARFAEPNAIACPSGYSQNRTESCFSGTAPYTVTDRDTGTEIGGAGVDETSRVTLNPRNRGKWTQTVTIELVAPWGAALETTGSTEIVCSSCKSTGGGAQQMLPDTPRTFSFTLSSPGTGVVKDVQVPMLTLQPDFPNTTPGVGRVGPYTHPRCDSTPRVGPKTGGCVYPEFTPTYNVSTTNQDTADVAWHIRWAQMNLTHHWGWQGHGPELTRTTSPSIIDANRDTACPSSIPRPEGKSCDEYPFASTYQGASRNPDFSCHLVNAVQNRLEGSRYRKPWYAANRLLDGDKFWVNVVLPAGITQQQIDQQERPYSQCPG